MINTDFYFMFIFFSHFKIVYLGNCVELGTHDSPKNSQQPWAELELIPQDAVSFLVM